MKKKKVVLHNIFCRVFLDTLPSCFLENMCGCHKQVRFHVLSSNLTEHMLLKKTKTKKNMAKRQKVCYGYMLTSKEAVNYLYQNCF